MTRHLHTIAWVLSAIGCPANATQPANVALVDDSWDTQQVAAMIESIQSQASGLDGFETEVSIAAYSSRKLESKPEESTAGIADEGKPDALQRVRLVVNGRRFRASLHAGDQIISRQYFDGETTARIRGDGSVVEYGVRLSPPDDREWVYRFNTMEAIPPMARDPLHEIIRQCDTSSVQTNGSRIVWRGHHPERPDVKREVEFDPGQRRLVRSTVHFVADSARGTPELRIDRVVTSWHEYDGVLLPHTGVIIVGSSSPDGMTKESGSWHRRLYRYERELLRRIEGDSGDASEFHPTLSQGTLVIDPRIGLRFTVGESRLILDGARYRTTSPLLSHPRGNLATILSSATIVDDEPMSISDSAGRSSFLPALVWGLCIAIAVLSGLAVLRTLRARNVRNRTS